MQITIAKLSEAVANQRIDSQFFRPEYVESSDVVSSGSCSVLSDIAHITDGNHLKIAENFDKLKETLRDLLKSEVNTSRKIEKIIYGSSEIRTYRLDVQYEEKQGPVV